MAILITTMHYLTREEYRKGYKCSRQVVHNKIMRGTLKTTIRKRNTEVILVEDTEYEKIKHNLVDEVNGKE